MQRLVEPKLRKRRLEIVFLSTYRSETLYSSLTAAHIHKTLLSDSHVEVAKDFDVVYLLDNATLAKQKQYGVHLDETTGTRLHELPAHSVFIIDATGTTHNVYSNPDYTVRLASDVLLAAAQPYAARSPAAQ